MNTNIRRRQFTSPFFLQESTGLLSCGVSTYWHDENPAEIKDGGVWWCRTTHQWLSTVIQQCKNILQGKKKQLNRLCISLNLIIICTYMNMYCLCVSSLTVRSTEQPVNFGTFTCGPKMNLFSEVTMMMMMKRGLTHKTTLEGPLRMRWHSHTLLMTHTLHSVYTANNVNL